VKKLLALVLSAFLLFSTAIATFAVEPAYTYEAQKLVNKVTFDGKITGDEWSDAIALVINADNKVFQEYGRFQTDPRVAAADKLSATYYIKWDENFLYICEQRLDKDGLNNPTVDPSGPWMGDGTAFFFADAIELSRADVRWIAYTEENAKKCAVYSQALDYDVTDEWDCYGGKDGDVYTIELAMPWAAMGDKLTQDIKEDALFRFCQIITSRANDDQYGNWDEEVQINFYDSFFKEELDNSENSDFHAGLKLVAAKAPAVVAEEPEMTTQDTPKENPKTSDNNMISLIVMITIAGTVLFLNKKKIFN